MVSFRGFVLVLAVLSMMTAGVLPIITADQGSTIDGPASSEFGSDVLMLDLDGDDMQELIVGAPATSKVYIFNGTDEVSCTPLDHTESDIVLSGTGAFGTSVFDAGDLNGDGFNDLGVHSPASPSIISIFLAGQTFTDASTPDVVLNGISTMLDIGDADQAALGFCGCSADDLALSYNDPSSGVVVFNGRRAMITEIMYDPPGNEPNDEWFEVYNPSPVVLNMTGWSFETAGGAWFEVPHNTLVQPFGRQVFSFSAMPGAVEYGPLDASFNLQNPGGSIVMYDEHFDYVDYIIYSPDWGTTGDNGNGGSLVRSMTYGNPNDNQTWTSTTSNTPGAADPSETIITDIWGSIISTSFTVTSLADFGDVNDDDLSDLAIGGDKAPNGTIEVWRGFNGPDPTVYFYENFETGLGQWDIDQDIGGVWATENLDSVSGQYCLSNYYTYAERDHIFNNAPIDLRTATNPWLTFWHRFQTDPKGDWLDHLEVEVAEWGTESWGMLRCYSDTNQTLSPWMRAAVDLSPYAGRQIKLRWHTTSDDNDYGIWRVDDIMVAEKQVTYHLNDDLTDLSNWDLTTTGLTGWTIETDPFQAPDGNHVVNNYEGYDNDTMTTKDPLDLTGVSTAHIIFHHVFRTEAALYDNLTVQIAPVPFTDWEIVKRFDNEENTSYTGYDLDITNYTGQSIKLRFSVTSDHAVNGTWFIEDIRVLTLEGATPQPFITLDGGGTLGKIGSTIETYVQGDQTHVLYGGDTTDIVQWDRWGMEEFSFDNASEFATLSGTNINFTTGGSARPGPTTKDLFYSTDFEHASYGDLASEWSITSGPGVTVDLTTETAFSGSQCLLIADIATNMDADLRYDIPPSKQGILKFTAKVDSTDDWCFNILMNEDDYEGGEFYFDGYFHPFIGWWDITDHYFVSYAPNTWYTFEAHWDTQTDLFQLFINDTLVYDNCRFAGDVEFIDNIRLQSIVDGTSNIWVDDLSIWTERFDGSEKTIEGAGLQLEGEPVKIMASNEGWTSIWGNGFEYTLDSGSTWYPLDWGMWQDIGPSVATDGTLGFKVAMDHNLTKCSILNDLDIFVVYREDLRTIQADSATIEEIAMVHNISKETSMDLAITSGSTTEVFFEDALTGPGPYAPSLILDGDQGIGSGDLRVGGYNEIAVGTDQDQVIVANIVSLLDKLTVIADQTTIGPNSTVILTVTGEVGGMEIPLSCVEWNTTPATFVGSNDSGAEIITPKTVGPLNITATVGDLTSWVLIDVVAGDLDSMEVVPAPDRFVAGQEYDIEAKGYDEFGNDVQVSPTWNCTMGTFSQTIGNLTTFTAMNTTGIGVFNATYMTFTLLYTIEVVNATPYELTIDPTSLTIKAGDNHDFDATLVDEFGNQINAILVWTVDNGSIDSDGIFTAPLTMGLASVTASFGALSVSSDVIVTHTDLVDFELNWTPTQPIAGSNVTFWLHGNDVYGNTVMLDCDWEFDGQQVATGVQMPSLEMPTTAGTYVVWANSSLASQTGIITVVPASMLELEIVTTGTFVPVDGTLFLTAYGRDQYDNQFQVPATWFTDLGTIDGNGTFSAGTLAGAAEVTASYAGYQISTFITIRPGAVSNVVVEPSDIKVQVGSETQFTARAYDQYGNEVITDPVWSTNVGDITNTGAFTAQDSNAEGYVSAQMDGVEGRATVTVEGEEDTSLMLIALVVVLIIVILIIAGVAIYFIIKKRGVEEEDEDLVIDEVYVIHHSGNLMCHKAFGDESAMDKDLVSGMIKAIESFVKDSFASDDDSSELEKIEFGSHNIMIRKSHKFSLALVYKSGSMSKLNELATELVDRIEEDYADIIEDWDGEMDHVRGIVDILDDCVIAACPDMDMDEDEVDLIESYDSSDLSDGYPQEAEDGFIDDNEDDYDDDDFDEDEFDEEDEDLEEEEIEDTDVEVDGGEMEDEEVEEGPPKKKGKKASRSKKSKSKR